MTHEQSHQLQDLDQGQEQTDQDQQINHVVEQDQALVPDRVFGKMPVPMTIGELSGVTDGLKILQVRAELVRYLRTLSIQLTQPEDWLLFRDRTGAVVGYLQDAGARRIAPLWGIEVYDVSPAERIEIDQDAFMYVQRGSGRCAITGQEIKDIEGGRESTEDFCADKRGAALELAVRKATRANLEGNIFRKLSGLQSVPERELRAAGLDVTRCRLGRGFYSQPDEASPACPKCGGPTKFIPAGVTSSGRAYKAFWTCRKPRGQCGGSVPYQGQQAKAQDQEDKVNNE